MVIGDLSQAPNNTEPRALARAVFTCQQESVDVKLQRRAITKRFRIGVVSTALTTTVHSVAKQFTSLYDTFETNEADPREIHVSVERTPLSFRHRPRFEVRVNGQLLFEPTKKAEILPCVEWAINWHVPRSLPEYLQVHASAMEFDGQGVIFPAASGSGKSTLTAGLLASGWGYLSDEFAMMDVDSFNLFPYPRAICIKKDSFPVIEKLGIPFHRSKKYRKGFKGLVSYIKPTDIRENAIASPCPIRHVIFPKYVAGCDPMLIPMTRAEAAFAIHRDCFNLLGCRGVGLDVIAGVIRNARCFRLQAGEINETVKLVTACVREMDQVQAVSA